MLTLLITPKHVGVGINSMPKEYSIMDNIRKGMIVKTCTNEVCLNLDIPPIILCADTCWNCHSADNLVVVIEGDYNNVL